MAVPNKQAKEILEGKKSLNGDSSLESIFKYYKKSIKNLSQLDFVLEFEVNKFCPDALNAKIRYIYNGITHEKLDKVFNISAIYNFCKLRPNILTKKVCIFSIKEGKDSLKIFVNKEETALVTITEAINKDNQKFISINYRSEFNLTDYGDFDF